MLGLKQKDVHLNPNILMYGSFFFLSLDYFRAWFVRNIKVVINSKCKRVLYDKCYYVTHIFITIFMSLGGLGHSSSFIRIFSCKYLCFYVLFLGENCWREAPLEPSYQAAHPWESQRHRATKGKCHASQQETLLLTLPLKKEIQLGHLLFYFSSLKVKDVTVDNWICKCSK